MGKGWGIAILALGACTSPAASVTPAPEPPVEVAADAGTEGTARRLEAVAELRHDVDRAASFGRALERTRNPITGWVGDGALILIVGDLDRRRHELRRRSRSRLEEVSLATDVDPELDVLLREWLEE